MIARKPLAAALLALAALPATTMAQAPKVLLIGDSWAQQQWSDQSHAQVFAANGAGQFQVFGASTTESGSTAAQWSAPGRLQTIAQALDERPEIDTVQITLGGNDFLDAWSTQMTPEQVADLRAQIYDDLATVVHFVLDHRPDIEVILSLYDYPNFRDTLTGGLAGLFLCAPMHQNMGQPTPLQLNTAMAEFEVVLGQLTQHPRVRHVGHAGQMQFTYGIDEMAPGELPPPGDPSRPSPLSSIRDNGGLLGRDCFHLTPAGYDVLVQNLYENYYHTRFDTLLRAPFE